MTAESFHTSARSVRVLLAATVLALSSAAAFGKDVKVDLTGAEETPPVTTSATGHGTIHIAKDKSVSGTVKRHPPIQSVGFSLLEWLFFRQPKGASLRWPR
jgi:hypothetical protein